MANQLIDKRSGDFQEGTKKRVFRLWESVAIPKGGTQEKAWGRSMNLKTDTRGKKKERIHNTASRRPLSGGGEASFAGSKTSKKRNQRGDSKKGF